ncbi:MAG: hypothetical protein ONB05_05240, partial [candidate division KSB1 bacterium]|nr:hypothetical protein [candidate division KSB1 bacterium]
MKKRDVLLTLGIFTLSLFLAFNLYAQGNSLIPVGGESKSGSIGNKAFPPIKTIYEIQYVPEESLAVGMDDSPFLGDTVVVEGIVAGSPRSLWAGARWSMIIVDPAGGPWNGLQVIQHDTTKPGTDLTAVMIGDKVRFTGVIEEYSYSGISWTQTQIALLTNPPVPVEFISSENPIPGPTVVTCNELATLEKGEKYEATLVKIKNATVLNNALPGNNMLIGDATGQITVNSWYNSLYDSLSKGTYRYPANGTRINLTGYIRSAPGGGQFYIGPRSSADIEVLIIPPVISNITRSPVAPTSVQNVAVTAKIKDPDGTVATATIYYSINNGPFQEVAMTSPDSIYTGTIPAQADGGFVKYFITS